MRNDRPTKAAFVVNAALLALNLWFMFHRSITAQAQASYSYHIETITNNGLGDTFRAQGKVVAIACRAPQNCFALTQ